MIDAEQWVSDETVPRRRRFRQAVHLVIRAIARCEPLSSTMVMKGGILIALKYGSPRFTRDIDFSTTRSIRDINVTDLLAMFQDALRQVSSDNEYGLGLRMQSHQVRPPASPKASFPTLKMKVGYAARTDSKTMRKLDLMGVSDVVEVDYSFNEWDFAVEREVFDGGQLAMYPFHDLVAEKLRSVLQQPIRSRNRFQDIYDLHLLLRCAREMSDQDRHHIHESLQRSARSRGIQPKWDSLRNETVRSMSKADYGTALPPLVPGDIPDFEIAYAAVQTLYESLPWNENDAI